VAERVETGFLDTLKRQGQPNLKAWPATPIQVNRRGCRMQGLTRHAGLPERLNSIDAIPS